MAIFVPKDRRSLFRQFLSGMYDGVVITDPNGYILEVNPRTVEYFARTGEELLDQPISVLIPGLKEDVVQRIRRGLGDDRHVVIDANGVSKAGAKIACEVAVSQIDLLNPGDLIFTIRNVERRRAFVNQLKAKAAAFHLSPTALFACDIEGKIVEANAAFLELFDLASVEAAREHSFTDFMNDAPLPENFRRALNGERTRVGLVAEGDAGEKEELEIQLGPNLSGQRVLGVVGSILKS